MKVFVELHVYYWLLLKVAQPEANSTELKVQ